MSTEIEVKAHIENNDSIQKRLSVMGNFYRSYTKSDSYWRSLQAGDYGVRIRREQWLDASGTAHDAVTATTKKKTISGGIEVNDEEECAVDDLALFEKSLQSRGMHKAMSKEKNGSAWTVQRGAGRPILAEVSLVAGLGWFLELEIIADDDRPELVEESRKRLLALLAELEIPASQIESRSYAKMLQNNVFSS